MTNINHGWDVSCGALCQHPSCWGTLGRRHQLAGYHRQDGGYESDSGSDTELPTMKVYDMLSDYGLSQNKRKSAIKARTSSSRSSNPNLKRMFDGCLSSELDAPFTTPASTRSPITAKSSNKRSQSATLTAATAVRDGKNVSRVFVHELVSVNERGQRDDKLGKKMVWVPKKKKHCTPRKPTIHQLASDVPGVVPVTDVTRNLLPPNIDVDRDCDGKRRQRAPPMGISPRRFYSGAPQTAPTVDLLSLPPDLLQAVIERVRQTTDLDESRIMEALMGVVPTFSRHADASSAAYRTMLKKKKVPTATLR